jgi:hypothetical protein
MGRKNARPKAGSIQGIRTKTAKSMKNGQRWSVVNEGYQPKEKTKQTCGSVVCPLCKDVV